MLSKCRYMYRVCVLDYTLCIHGEKQHFYQTDTMTRTMT